MAMSRILRSASGWSWLFPFGILNFLPAPPAFALQDGGEFAAELFQRPPLFSGIDDGGIDV